ncbi:hypothetical protein C3L21_30285 (plasmid) [Sinorhizobium meliloti]|nr:hypothetical protein C3L21_30285 [Sinorhizobium meliloti]
MFREDASKSRNTIIRGHVPPMYQRNLGQSRSIDMSKATSRDMSECRAGQQQLQWNGATLVTPIIGVPVPNYFKPDSQAMARSGTRLQEAPMRTDCQSTQTGGAER